MLWEALRGKESLTGSPAGIIGKICSGKLMDLDPGERVDPRVQRAVGFLLRIDPKERPRRARDAAAMFAMIEKEIAGDTDVDHIAAACVIAAVGPPAADVADPKRVMARAQAVFGAEARLQTTGLADLDKLAAEPMLLEERLEDSAPMAASTADRDEPPKTPAGKAILSYAKMLKKLEGKEITGEHRL